MSVVPPLTRRQHDTLALAATGLSYKEVAAVLDISPITVHGHLKAAFRRSGAEGLVQTLFRRGWIVLP